MADANVQTAPNPWRHAVPRLHGPHVHHPFGTSTPSGNCRALMPFDLQRKAPANFQCTCPTSESMQRFRLIHPERTHTHTLFHGPTRTCSGTQNGDSSLSGNCSAHLQLAFLPTRTSFNWMPQRTNKWIFSHQSREQIRAFPYCGFV